MGVKVVIPLPLRQYTERKDIVVAEGQTVEEVLRSLTAHYGDLRKHLYGEDGKLRSFVNIYRNDEDIRYLEREKTPVKENDVLNIVPSIAGGREGRAGPSPASLDFARDKSRDRDDSKKS